MTAKNKNELSGNAGELENNEEKWREEFEKIHMSELGHYSERWKDGKTTKIFDGSMWEAYLAARRKAQEEINQLEEVVKSCNDRNKALVDAGWKNILRAEKSEDENKKLKALLVQAKDWTYVEHPYECNSVVLNLPCSLDCEPDKVQWLKKYEEVVK